jgi:hypothetical protein
MVLCGTIMDIKKGGPAPAFEIQIRTPKGWSNDLWGCDVGNQAVPETIKTGDVEEFRIKLHEQGTYRLHFTASLVHLKKPATIAKELSAVSLTRSRRHGNLG